jgi:hypothetical protein
MHLLLPLPSRGLKKTKQRYGGRSVRWSGLQRDGRALSRGLVQWAPRCCGALSLSLPCRAAGSQQPAVHSPVTEEPVTGRSSAGQWPVASGRGRVCSGHSQNGFLVKQRALGLGTHGASIDLDVPLSPPLTTKATDSRTYAKLSGGLLDSDCGAGGVGLPLARTGWVDGSWCQQQAWDGSWCHQPAPGGATGIMA